ncbi:ABC transporter permease [Candidatus Chlorohelix sp.]|uniref:ABC transporter permease n=1 Tax=Candidatus Chlorohelix sp. TaxID=3139201 RepID=UPI00305ADB84
MDTLNQVDFENEPLIDTFVHEEARVSASTSNVMAGSCPVIREEKTRPRGRPGVLKRLLRDKVALVCITYLGLLGILALLAPLLAPYDYKFQDLAHVRETPSSLHWFGTDQLGRDIFSRILYGARISLAIGISVMLVETAVGVLLGLLSGYLGGWVETGVMRLADLTYAFPGLLLAILLVGMLGRDLFWLFAAFVILGWPNIARMVRSQVLTLRERDYVHASIVSGAGFGWIVRHHILPNCASVIIISASTSVGGIMLAEAGLSFVGLGVQPPYPSLGSMISELAQLIKSRPLLMFFPSLTLSLAIMSLNLLGDALRDAFDPTLSR